MRSRPQRVNVRRTPVAERLTHVSATVPTGLDLETPEFTLESIDEFDADALARIRAAIGG